jgi:hypothetical protein
VGSRQETNTADDFLGRQRVLVISPHADDETYGCAGTIARIKALGGEVFVSLISVGSLDHDARADDGTKMRRVTAETRLHDFSQVMKLLEDQHHEALFRACITATRPGVHSERHLIPTWTSPTTYRSSWKRCGCTHLRSESLNFTRARRTWNS